MGLHFPGVRGVRGTPEIFLGFNFSFDVSNSRFMPCPFRGGILCAAVNHVGLFQRLLKTIRGYEVGYVMGMFDGV